MSLDKGLHMLKKTLFVPAKSGEKNGLFSFETVKNKAVNYIEYGDTRKQARARLETFLEEITGANITLLIREG